MKFYTNIKKHGTHLLVREIENGVRKDKKIKFQPTLFRECKEDPSQLHRSIFDVPLKPMKFNDMREADTFITNNKYVTHGNQNYIAQFIAETYRGDIVYDDDKIRTHFIDIEVHADEFPEPSSAKFEISAITVYDTILKTYYVWGQNPAGKFSVDSIHDEKIKTLKIDYHECNDEVHLLKSFLSFFSGKYSPDIITGWNSDGFDIAYLVNRITNLFGNKEVSKLSPWNIVREKTAVDKFGKKVFEYDLYGISSLDYLKLFKKFGYAYGTQTSYKLDDISEVVLGQQKIKFEGSLYELYKNDYQKYVEYNIMDVSLLVAMEEKTSLLKLATSMSYIAGSNFQDVFGTVSIWDSFINKYLFEKNIIVPPKIINNTENEYMGGYVKEVSAGSFDWVCSFDINSLYPSIIVQWNMSPETLVRGTIKDPSKYTISKTGEYFSKHRVGFIPEIVSMLYDKRVEYKGISKQWQTKAQKNDSYEVQKNIVTFSNKEKAMKIFLNSLYGAMANPFFRYFEIKIAESITMTGQHIIKTVENDVNRYISNITKQPKEYVIASDTDSVVGDTLVYVNDKQMKISDLYDSISEYEKFDENGQNFVKPVTEIKTKAFDTTKQSVVDSPIKYVMKHRVKKEMFRITVDGKTVDVTCDHSIIVNRDGKFLSVSPKNILSSDKIIHI